MALTVGSHGWWMVIGWDGFVSIKGWFGGDSGLLVRVACGLWWIGRLGRDWWFLIWLCLWGRGVGLLLWFSGIGGCGVCCGWVWWFKFRFSDGVRDLRVDRWSYCFWVLSCMLIVWVMRARWVRGLVLRLWVWCEWLWCNWVLVSLMSSGYAVGLLMEFYDAVSWRFLGLGGISRRLDSFERFVLWRWCVYRWWSGELGLFLGLSGLGSLFDL